jgi:hypothetical protein
VGRRLDGPPNAPVAAAYCSFNSAASTRANACFPIALRHHVSGLQGCIGSHLLERRDPTQQVIPRLAKETQPRLAACVGMLRQVPIDLAQAYRGDSDRVFRAQRAVALQHLVEALLASQVQGPGFFYLSGLEQGLRKMSLEQAADVLRI